MTFPRWGGFSGPEQQVSDQFARSVVASLLVDTADALDTADAPEPALSSTLRAIARREADHLAAARLKDRRGGWSYFPLLPELPPDLDSLSAAVLLFARIAPQHLPLCDEPLALALGQCDASGAAPIWLIHPDDPARERERMRRSVSLHWGDTVDVDVMARFAAALCAAGRTADAAPTLDFLRRRQQADGLWPATWYWSPLVSADLALYLPGLPTQAARRTLLSRQADDGGWGWPPTAPDDRTDANAEPPDCTTQDTALALGILAHPAGRSLLGTGTDTSAAGAALARGVAWLCDNQTRRGAWRASPWIRMDIGRAGGRSVYCARFGCEAVETALALRALARVACL